MPIVLLRWHQELFQRWRNVQGLSQTILASLCIEFAPFLDSVNADLAGLTSDLYRNEIVLMHRATQVVRQPGLNIRFRMSTLKQGDIPANRYATLEGEAPDIQTIIRRQFSIDRIPSR